MCAKHTDANLDSLYYHVDWQVASNWGVDWDTLCTQIWLTDSGRLRECKLGGGPIAGGYWAPCSTLVMNISEGYSVYRLTQDCEDFIDEHPASRYASMLEAVVDSLKMVNSWETTLRKFQNGGFLPECELTGFIVTYPASPFTDSARILLGEAKLLNDWNFACQYENIKRYEDFRKRHPESRYDTVAVRRLDELIRCRDGWNSLGDSPSKRALQDFVRRNPDCLYTDSAKAKIVDIEIVELVGSHPGKLPPASKVRSVADRAYSVVNIWNNTSYKLTVSYWGAETFSVEFDPEEKSSIELANGGYKVAARVSAQHVSGYVGTDEFDGGDYEVQFYITDMMNPILPAVKFGPFRQYQCKRKYRGR